MRDGNVDVENPAPTVVVGDPSAQGGADRRRDDDGHAVHGKSHAAFRGRKRIGENGLLAGLQSAAARALQDAEKYQRAEARSQAAKKAAGGKQRDAGHVETLAAHSAWRARR